MERDGGIETCTVHPSCWNAKFSDDPHTVTKTETQVTSHSTRFNIMSPKEALRQARETVSHHQCHPLPSPSGSQVVRRDDLCIWGRESPVTGDLYIELSAALSQHRIKPCWAQPAPRRGSIWTSPSRRGTAHPSDWNLSFSGSLTTMG